MQITIVIPVYNEAKVIEEVIRGFYTKVMRRLENAELLIAEDGSTDGTKTILARLKEEIPFTLVTGETRKGYTRAFKDALSIPKTGLIFFSDSDAQHDPEDIFALLQTIEGQDIVSGYKSPRKDPLHRIILSLGYNGLINLLFGLKMKDIDSGFKLIRREVIDAVLPSVKSFNYCVMSEFILRANLAGYRIKEVPVKHFARKAGGTAIFQPAKLPGIVLGLIKNLIELKTSEGNRR